MNKQALMVDLNALSEDFFHKWRLSKEVQPFENTWYFPNEKESGAVHEIDLQPGLQIVFMDLKPKEKLAMTLELENAPLTFSFFLSGNVRYNMRLSGFRKDIFDRSAGHSVISFIPMSTTGIEIMTGQNLSMVSVMVIPEVLSTYFEEYFDEIPNDLRSIINGCNEDCYYRLGTVNISMQMTIHQIFSCPYHGLMKKMYLASKAVELMAHLLEQLVFDNTGHKSNAVLGPKDIERIREARDILVSDLENPPTLWELARQAGINKNKLNQGFHKVFGVSVFEYLRSYKLEQSRQFLEDRSTNISEVALRVGYAQPSTFSTAFKQYFGVTPKRYTP